jgi:gentisate 1,2-dioxygenase
VIEGQRFDWAEGDVFVVPNWRWHEHASAMGRDAILFSVSDEPVMRALGMYREQAFAGPSGRQEITAVFDPV